MFFNSMLCYYTVLSHYFQTYMFAPPDTALRDGGIVYDPELQRTCIQTLIGYLVRGE